VAWLLDDDRFGPANWTVVVERDRGRVTAISSAPGTEDAPGAKIPALPPEWLGARARARFDVATLDDKIDDSPLAPQGELLNVLFPRLTSDMGWVL
jgi:hypothetical protein